MKTIRHRRKTETAAALITASVLALLSLSAAGADYLIDDISELLPLTCYLSGC